jgi:hypothetical protein
LSDELGDIFAVEGGMFDELALDVTPVHEALYTVHCQA